MDYSELVNDAANMAKECGWHFDSTPSGALHFIRASKEVMITRPYDDGNVKADCYLLFDNIEVKHKIIYISTYGISSVLNNVLSMMHYSVPVRVYRISMCRRQIEQKFIEKFDNDINIDLSIRQNLRNLYNFFEETVQETSKEPGYVDVVLLFLHWLEIEKRISKDSDNYSRAIDVLIPIFRNSVDNYQFLRK